MLQGLLRCGTGLGGCLDTVLMMKGQCINQKIIVVYNIKITCCCRR